MSEATSVKSNIVCLPRSRESETHRLGSEGEPLAVVLDDVVGGGVVGDDLDLAGDDVTVVGDSLNSDNDDVHVVSSLFLAATATYLYLKRQGYVQFLYHTRRGLNRQRNILIPLFTNQDLISCLHLLVNDTLSDKEFFTQLVNKS